MLIQFQKHIQNTFPFLYESNLFVAVSGGVDSMVLVDLFMKLNLKFTILHCNFQLRGKESDNETEFLRNFCKQNAIPYIIKYFDTANYSETNKISIQLAARELRYNWFYDEINAKGNGFLLTAHHADDNLETFIINLSRGTGLEGLTGIPEQNEYTIRPLLPFSRSEIEAYARQSGVVWKEDSSNASDKYLRNKIRHQIVPLLTELHPTFLENFQKTQYFLKNSQQFIENQCHIVYEQIVEKEETEIRIPIEKLTSYSDWRTYLYYWLNSLGFTAWNDIYNLVLHSQTGKIVTAKEYTLLKNRNHLIIYKSIASNNIFTIFNSSSSLKFPLNITLENVNYSNCLNRNTIFVDREKLQFPLTIRNKQEGDIFYPQGMNGKKKLSKYFKDEKYSILEKQQQWLLISNNEIVWVIGKRADRRFLANENTQQILKIEVKEP